MLYYYTDNFFFRNKAHSLAKNVLVRITPKQKVKKWGWLLHVTKQNKKYLGDSIEERLPKFLSDRPPKRKKKKGNDTMVVSLPYNFTQQLHKGKKKIEPHCDALLEDKLYTVKKM